MFSMIVGNLRRTACEENLPKRLRSSRVEPGLIPRNKKKKKKKRKKENITLIRDQLANEGLT
jgi:hypothetical protein